MNLAMSRLMGEILDRQSEPEESFDDIEFAERVHDILQSSTELPDDLARLVWISPTARSIFLRLRAEALAAAKRRWVSQGFSTELERLAADSDSDFDSFSASGVAMRMVFNAATGQWLISLQLTAEAFNELPAGIAIKVADSGGFVWLEGVLDRYGGLDGFWEGDERGPRERLREHRLLIDLF